MTWLAVGLGGALGSLARHAVNHLVDTLMLAQTHSSRMAAINIAVHVVGGLAAVAIGYWLGLTAR